MIIYEQSACLVIVYRKYTCQIADLTSFISIEPLFTHARREYLMRQVFCWWKNTLFSLSTRITLVLCDSLNTHLWIIHETMENKWISFRSMTRLIRNLATFLKYLILHDFSNFIKYNIYIYIPILQTLHDTLMDYFFRDLTYKFCMFTCSNFFLLPPR